MFSTLRSAYMPRDLTEISLTAEIISKDNKENDYRNKYRSKFAY